jgi:RND family efflux transporter MFP subunit
MHKTPKTLIYTILVGTGLLFGCGQENKFEAPPPPPVTVAEPLQQGVTEYLEFTGTTQAFEEVEVRARVSGFLQSVEFTPGTEVEEGDLLFVIDPREYEADLSAANAEVKAGEAEMERARIELGRAQRLFKQKAGSESDVVKWRGEREVAQAQVYRARAKVERAVLNLSYTRVTTPLGGRVSRNLVDPGNLVGEGEPTLLTTVANFEPIYAYFNLNELDYLRAIKLFRASIEKKGADPREESVREADIPLFLGLVDEEGYPHEGVLDFAETGIDPGTGTLKLRGVFPNPGKVPVLRPGLFARLRMPIRERPDVLLVAERAIGSDQGGRYLLVVNSSNMVEKRPIRQGQLEDGLRVIEEGLRAGERVIVKGVQRARPGAQVNPEQIDMTSLTVTALRAAAEAEAKKAAARAEQQAASGESAPADEPPGDNPGSGQ